MPFVEGIKFACVACIKGHRSANCPHADRPLLEIKKKGRPATQCERCHALRKTKHLHTKCECGDKPNDRPPPIELPNGLPAGPILPCPPTDSPPVVRAKSLSKRPAKPHDLDHGHQPHHVAAPYSPYPGVASHALARSHSTSSRSSISTPSESSPALLLPAPPLPLPSLPSLGPSISQADTPLSFPAISALDLPFDDSLAPLDTSLDLLDTSALDGPWDLSSFFPAPPSSTSSYDSFTPLESDPFPPLDLETFLALAESNGAWSASSLENGWATPDLDTGGWTSEEGASAGGWEVEGGIDRWRSELSGQDWGREAREIEGYGIEKADEGLGCEGYAVV